MSSERAKNFSPTNMSYVHNRSIFLKLRSTLTGDNLQLISEGRLIFYHRPKENENNFGEVWITSCIIYPVLYVFVSRMKSHNEKLLYALIFKNI